MWEGFFVKKNSTGRNEWGFAYEYGYNEWGFA